MNTARLAALGVIGALAAGCPGLLPGTDRDLGDAAVAADLGTPDVGVLVDRGFPVDIPMVVDLGRPDTGPRDTGGIVDTGPGPDTGPTSPGRCGDDDQPCCAFGECREGRACLREAAGGATCQDCGADDQPCCAFGECRSQTACVAGAGVGPTCQDCGDRNKPCCQGGSCSGGSTCEWRSGELSPMCR